MRNGARPSVFSLRRLGALVLFHLATSVAIALDDSHVQARVDGDLVAGKPIVAHVIVALCDNAHQGIVPVPASLGNGRDPASNLYWGARYGVRTYFKLSEHWRTLKSERPSDHRILDRVVFFGTIERRKVQVPVYVVADAWDGAEIGAALEAFQAVAAGHSPEVVRVRNGAREVTLDAGGAAHLVAFVGHNGLMDLTLKDPEPAGVGARPVASVVLACASKPFFLDRLLRAGSSPLLLTTGLMAPEAYTLDAVLRSWSGGESPEKIRDAAAGAYDKFQRCGINAARRLFWVDPPSMAAIDWRTLSQGMDLATIVAHQPSDVGDSRIVILRIDPALWDLELRGSGLTKGSGARSAKTWCKEGGLTACINAGMFASDFRTHLGYLRFREHDGTPETNAYQSIAAFDPRRGGLPPFRMLDLDAPGVTMGSITHDYASAVQNLRLIKRPGSNRWGRQAKRWSEAALGEDAQGRILFIVSRSPFSMNELNLELLDSGIGIVAAQHLEGGPEAQLYVNVGGTELELVGSFETGFQESDKNDVAWPVPNILGVRPKAAKSDGQ